VAQLALSDPTARRKAVLAAIEEAGLTAESQTFLDGENFRVVVPGKKPSILLTAHYDSYAVSQGNPGAMDNASGVAVAILLAKEFKKVPVGHEVEIAFLDQEESGHEGAFAFINNRSPSDFLAVINIDMAGVGNTISILRSLESNKPVRNLLLQAAEELDIPVVATPTVSHAIGADDVAFLANNVKNVIGVGLVPAADVCKGLLYAETGKETPPPDFMVSMHSPEDTVDKMQPAEMVSLANVLQQTIRALDEAAP